MTKVYRLSKRGFSLIEMMIAVGVMAIVSLGFGKMMVNSMSANRNVMQTSEANDIKNAVASLLGPQAACTANLGANRLGTSTDIVNYNGASTSYNSTLPFINTAAPPVTVIGVGNPLPPDNSIQINSWSIINWQATDNLGGPTITDGIATLQLNISKVGSSIGSQNFVRNIPILVDVKTAAPHTIDHCYVISATDVYWQRGSGATDIYYNGTVGINAMAPSPYALDVEGAWDNQIVVGNNAGASGAAGSIMFRRGDNGLVGSSIGYTAAGVGTDLRINNTSLGGRLLLTIPTGNAPGATTDVLAISGGSGNALFQGPGSIGVHTANPAGVLHVVADTTAGSGTTGAIVAGSKANSNNRIYMGYDNAANAGLIQADSFGAGGRPLLLNSAGGNVGIGTVAPSAALEIKNGSGATADIKLTYGTSGSGRIWNDGNLHIQAGAATQPLWINADQVQFYNYAQATSYATFDASGNFNAAHNITVAGNATMTGTATASAFIYTSDERLKNKGKKLAGIEIIQAINGYSFTWKKDGRRDAGVMAQEVEKVFPEAVRTNDDGYKAVDYAKLVAPLIEAFKTQQEHLNVQEKEIEVLEEEIRLLKAQHDGHAP